MKNKDTGKYDWLHIFYQRIHSLGEDGNIAVGFAIKVNLQQEHLRKYQAELDLRRKLFDNAAIFYRMNLSTLQVEEYFDKRMAKHLSVVNIEEG